MKKIIVPMISTICSFAWSLPCHLIEQHTANSAAPDGEGSIRWQQGLEQEVRLDHQRILNGIQAVVANETKVPFSVDWGRRSSIGPLTYARGAGGQIVEAVSEDLGYVVRMLPDPLKSDAKGVPAKYLVEARRLSGAGRLESRLTFAAVNLKKNSQVVVKSISFLSAEECVGVVSIIESKNQVTGGLMRFNFLTGRVKQLITQEQFLRENAILFFGSTNVVVAAGSIFFVYGNQIQTLRAKMRSDNLVERAKVFYDLSKAEGNKKLLFTGRIWASRNRRALVAEVRNRSGSGETGLIILSEKGAEKIAQVAVPETDVGRNLWAVSLTGQVLAFALSPSTNSTEPQVGLMDVVSRQHRWVYWPVDPNSHVTSVSWSGNSLRINSISVSGGGTYNWQSDFAPIEF